MEGKKMLSEKWLPTSIKVLKKNNDEKEKALNNYDKALELTKELREKFNCGVADIPTNKITENERKILIKSYLLLGYSKESAIEFSK
jgi:Flp pilus assembly CpaE family ATPase